MPNKTNISQNQTIAEPEMGNSGVEHSRAQAVESKDSTANIDKMISALEKSLDCPSAHLHRSKKIRSLRKTFFSQR